MAETPEGCPISSLIVNERLSLSGRSGARPDGPKKAVAALVPERGGVDSASTIVRSNESVAKSDAGWITVTNVITLLQLLLCSALAFVLLLR